MARPQPEKDPSPVTSMITFPLEWPIAETRIPERQTRPVLSIVVATYNRTAEMTMAVESICDQIDESLSEKVEVIVSDNASSPEHQTAIRDLSIRYPDLVYYFNSMNGDADLQWLTAPHRARGEWVWLFGDDDLLAPGGVTHVVNRLEMDRPFFLTLNRCVVDNDLKNLLSTSKHNVPSKNLDSFIELTKYIGIDQITFITSQIYNTDIARQIDTNAYYLRRSGFAQVAYYVEAFSDLPSAYDATVFVIHRWQPDAHEKHAFQFRHLSICLPRDIAFARDRAGLPADIMERLGGGKSIGQDRFQNLTYVDYLFHYLLATIANINIDPADWDFLEAEAQYWRADRQRDLHEARMLDEALAALRENIGVKKLEIEQIQNQTGVPDALKRLALAAPCHELSQLEQSYFAKAHDAIDVSRRRYS